jgi:hypothetical protein
MLPGSAISSVSILRRLASYFLQKAVGPHFCVIHRYLKVNIYRAPIDAHSSQNEDHIIKIGIYIYTSIEQR